MTTRERNYRDLCRHHGVNPSNASLDGITHSDQVERYAAVGLEMHREHENAAGISTWPSEEDAMRALGDAFMDGYTPEAVYDLDTGTRIDLHVSTPVVSRSEDQGVMENPLEKQVPHGVAWPVLADGTNPPPGWSWVERDDELDIFEGDEAAAKAMIEAGFGSQFWWFNRETHKAAPEQDLFPLIGYSVAIDYPQPLTEPELRFDEHEAEEGYDCPRCEMWIPAYREKCSYCGLDTTTLAERWQ